MPRCPTSGFPRRRADRARGIAALERALELYVERDEALHAWQVAGELIHAEPQSINRYQARVEVAAKMKDTPKLCEAYQALGPVQSSPEDIVFPPAFRKECPE